MFNKNTIKTPERRNFTFNLYHVSREALQAATGLGEDFITLMRVELGRLIFHVWKPFTLLEVITMKEVHPLS